MLFGVSYLELLANAWGHSLIFALLTYVCKVCCSFWIVVVEYVFYEFFPSTSSLSPLCLLFPMHKKEDNL